jgi:hypothetical protein
MSWSRLTRRWSRGIVHAYLDVDLAMVNRPHVDGFRWGDRAGVSVGWGNGFSDLVWSVGVEVRRPGS